MTKGGEARDSRRDLHVQGLTAAKRVESERLVEAAEVAVTTKLSVDQAGPAWREAVQGMVGLSNQVGYAGVRQGASGGSEVSRNEAKQGARGAERARVGGPDPV
jgi:hypothetical protein